ncbi:S8 family serine peptidase [Melioribacter sp. OK-6-Me]|uniref:S8 family serine peptidase n=1 Tax=unclassified Melioribacter TaxID=2627329 RepID=UPI003ED86C8D
MKSALGIIIFLFITVTVLPQDEIKVRDNIYYLSNTIVVKLKEADTDVINLKKEIERRAIKISGIVKAFSENKNVLKKGIDRFESIYLLKIDNNEDPFEISAKLNKLKEIEWAEPKFIRRVTVTPNDPILNSGRQYNIGMISAEKAWDISKGDTSIIIAIIDTGVDWNHPDLKANILFDSNGNLVGIDFGGLNGSEDNDPREDVPPDGKNSYHGTHVAGIASAVTNNSIGVAGVGFNCTIMPVKVSRGDMRDANGYPYVYYGFEGIKWAVDHGAKIINCSWGGYGYSRYEKEVIDYAIENGAVIVAAAGNENSNNLFYPASYEGVLSVGWLNEKGEKANYNQNSGSNYGTQVDIMAPGSYIYSTWPTYAGPDSVYRSISGSSMATPHAAGVAGLVAARFSNYLPLQIAERIRASGITLENIQYQYLLGKGRIDAYNAVKDTNLYSIRATKIDFIEDGNGNGLFESGEAVNVRIRFTNYLDPSPQTKVYLLTNDVSVTIDNNEFNLPPMNTLDTADNSSSLFRFVISEDCPYNHTVDVMIKYEGNSYDDYQWFSIRINPTYATHDANKIVLTITSKGTLGFNDYPDNQEGRGFVYKNGDNLIFEGAFMYGTSFDKVMDAARSDYFQSEDFNIIEKVRITSDQNNNQIGRTLFDDSGFGEGALGIKTELTSYGFSNPLDDSYIILVNRLINQSGIDINGLYAGYFFDWDMPAEIPDIDIVDFDEEDRFGYVFCKNDSILNTYVGIALLDNDSKLGFYPIENSADTGAVMLFDENGFTKKEKWTSLTSGLINKQIGPADVSMVISSGPHTLNAGSDIVIPFVIAAGESLEELRSTIHRARDKYNQLITEIREPLVKYNYNLSQNYPNPFNPSTVINYEVPERNFVTIKVYDILGREVATLVNELKEAGSYRLEFSADKYGLASGIYFYTLNAADHIFVRKMIFAK